MTDPIRIEELEDELLVLCARNTMLEARAKRLAAELELRNHTHVWAGNDPFTGEQVVGLLKENESLRARDRESEAMLIHYQHCLQAVEAHTARLAKALVLCAIPLEALHASVTWELAPELKKDIGKAVVAIRAALSAPDAQAGASGRLEQELVEWIMNPDNVLRSAGGGGEICIFCGVEFDYDAHGKAYPKDHKPGCLHIRAKAAVEQALKGETK